MITPYPTSVMALRKGLASSLGNRDGGGKSFR